MKHVDVLGVTVELATGAHVAVLRELDEPHRILPIFIGEAEAASISVALSGTDLARPLTHDLMTSVLDYLDAHIDIVEVTGMRDGAFIAELEVSSPQGTLRIDARPSDAIALAVRSGAPVFVREEVLDAAGVLASVVPTEALIDDEVAAFRDQLQTLGNLDDAAGEL